MRVKTGIGLRSELAQQVLGSPGCESGTRERDTQDSLTRPVLCCVYYFEAPATQSN